MWYLPYDSKQHAVTSTIISAGYFFYALISFGIFYTLYGEYKCISSPSSGRPTYMMFMGAQILAAIVFGALWASHVDDLVDANKLKR